MKKNIRIIYDIEVDNLDREMWECVKDDLNDEVQEQIKSWSEVPSVEKAKGGWREI